MRLLLPPSRTVAPPLAERTGGESRRAPIDHFTGTLYKALGAASWTAAERRWALAHLLVHDKDAGIVAAGSWDPLPLVERRGKSLPLVEERGKAVRLETTRPQGPFSLVEERGRAVRLETTPRELVIDARSQEYVRLILPPATAWTLRVVSEDSEGRRLAISHWNKHHKGVLAAALVRDRPRVRRIGDLLDWASGAGIRLEATGDRSLDLVI